MPAEPSFRRSRPYRIFIGVVGLASAVVLSWSLLNTWFYSRAIPPEIGLTVGLATTGSTMRPWHLLLPVPHEACGGAIFGLSDTTATLLDRQGLEHLLTARQGRGYTDRADRSFGYYSYEPWLPTPLAHEWTSEGMWPGLYCTELGFGLGRRILEAGKAPGSFYTTGRNKMLLVIPSLKLVVFTYTR